MILVLHIAIALASIIATTRAFFRPSKAQFYSSYGLIGATLASGTYLVVSTHSPMIQSCVTGLTYLLVVSVGIFAAHHHYQLQSND
jgi:hypothetical protein